MQIRCNNCFDVYDEQFDVCPFCGYVQGAPAREPYYIYPGMVLNDRYVIGQVLGAGGFGITYKAWDKRLKAVMAIKEYYPSGLVNRVPGTKEVILFSRNRIAEYNHGLMRFLDEAKSMAKFNAHKNIINVFEYFEENDTGYIVMEFLDGTTLSAFLKSNKLDLKTNLELIQDVCAALKDIHKAGIVHRDISPDNIFMCTNNNIKLIDFGAARFYPDEDRQMTIILKPGYAPPEQYEQVNVQGPWTDIYALGATLYLMITGVKPDESTNRRIDDTLLPPDQVVEGIPEYISNSVMKAMAIDRHLRFHSIADFEKALNNEKKVLPVMKEKKRRQQRRIASVLSAVAVLAIAAGILYWYYVGNVVQDADITLWYSLSEDAAVNSAKEAAVLQIAADFMESYREINVDIHVVVESFPADTYASQLRSAAERGEMPTLFESAGLPYDILSHAIDLSGIVTPLNKGEYNFLDKYATHFPAKNQVPLAFVAPVIYVNTTLLTYTGNGVSDLSALYAASVDVLNASADPDAASIFPGVINGECITAFTDAFGNYTVSQLTSEQAKELFFEGRAVFYMSNTADYLRVQDALPAECRILRVDSAIVPCQFTDLWSISKCSSRERKAAEKLLENMLTQYSQESLYMTFQGGRLPLNIAALETFTIAFGNFSDFFANITNYELRYSLILS